MVQRFCAPGWEGRTNLRVRATRRSARSFSIGAATVTSHVSSVLTKLGPRDRTQIVVFAYESGLVQAGDLDIGH